MAITNAVAIRWSNEQLRPVSEAMRNLYLRMTDLNQNWNAGLNAVFPNDPVEKLEDGRTVDGVTKLSGEDVTNFVAQVQAVLAVLDGAGVMDVVRKPNVRFLHIDPTPF